MKSGVSSGFSRLPTGRERRRRSFHAPCRASADADLLGGHRQDVGAQHDTSIRAHAVRVVSEVRHPAEAARRWPLCVATCDSQDVSIQRVARSVRIGRGNRRSRPSKPASGVRTRTRLRGRILARISCGFCHRPACVGRCRQTTALSRSANRRDVGPPRSAGGTITHRPREADIQQRHRDQIAEATEGDDTLCLTPANRAPLGLEGDALRDVAGIDFRLLRCSITRRGRRA